jgi:hypothetical protein
MDCKITSEYFIDRKFGNPLRVNLSHQYYDTEYGDSFPTSNYYIYLYETIASVLHVNEKCYPDVCQALEKAGGVANWSHSYHKKGVVVPNSILYCFYSLCTFVTVQYKKKETSFSVRQLDLSYEDSNDDENDYSLEYECEITIHYSHYENIKGLLEIIEQYKIKNSESPKISLVISTSRGFATTEQEIKHIKDLDIGLHYGEKFVKVHEKIVEKLNREKEKGLVLLHGIPGTGKTSYIRYLCSLIKKQIIFLPPNLSEHISSPEFIPFLLENTNSILIIEDAEKVVLERDSRESSRQGVSNILNMTDGILGDCLSIQIIATFNTSRDKIDSALLRKGRLIAEHKFDLLDVENSNKLLKYLEKNYVTSQPMSLTDIYNLDEEHTVSQEERRTIGFNRF